MTNDTCNFPPCNKASKKAGFCGGHYMQKQRYGQMWDGPKPRTKKPVHERFWANVRKSSDGGCWEWTGPLNSDGYGTLNVDGKHSRAHRLIFELMGKPLDASALVDHVCRNITCVNPSHLRPATKKLNGENLSTISSRSKSGIRGVYWVKDRKKWRAQVGHNGRVVCIGNFDTIEEAAEASRLKRMELYQYNEEDRAKA